MIFVCDETDVRVTCGVFGIDDSAVLCPVVIRLVVDDGLVGCFLPFVDDICVTSGIAPISVLGSGVFL